MNLIGMAYSVSTNVLIAELMGISAISISLLPLLLLGLGVGLGMSLSLSL